MPVYFGYAFALGLFSLVWLIFYFIRPDLRREMLWAGLVALPFGFTAVLYVPEYWNPPSAFGLLHSLGGGLEDVMYAFLTGGIASAAYEVLGRRRLRRVSSTGIYSLVPYVVFALVFAGLELASPDRAIYNVTVAFLLGSVVIGFLRRDLIHHMIVSAFFFAGIYFFVFEIVNLFFPTFVATYYTPGHLFTQLIFGVPLGDIVFPFAGGAFWSVLYEEVNHFRTVRSK